MPVWPDASPLPEHRTRRGPNPSGPCWRQRTSCDHPHGHREGQCPERLPTKGPPWRLHPWGLARTKRQTLRAMNTPRPGKAHNQGHSESSLSRRRLWPRPDCREQEQKAGLACRTCHLQRSRHTEALAFPIECIGDRKRLRSAAIRSRIYTCNP